MLVAQPRGKGVAARSGDVEPKIGCAGVLRHTTAGTVEKTRHVLRIDEAGAGCLPVKHQGTGKILWHAAAIIIHDSERKLGEWISTPGKWLQNGNGRFIMASAEQKDASRWRIMRGGGCCGQQQERADHASQYRESTHHKNIDDSPAKRENLLFAAARRCPCVFSEFMISKQER
jgi:hypothetical protein